MIDVVLVSDFADFTYCSNVSIVDFEQVNMFWVRLFCSLFKRLKLKSEYCLKPN